MPLIAALKRSSKNYSVIHFINEEKSTDAMERLIIIIVIIIIPRQCLRCCRHGRANSRAHPVHLMNVERRQAVADPSDQV